VYVEAILDGDGETKGTVLRRRLCAVEPSVDSHGVVEIRRKAIKEKTGRAEEGGY
jgi:hypothetical protein